MLELGLAFIVIVALVAAMSVGVLCGRKPIKGTCGGMAALNMGADCDICGGDVSKCDDDLSTAETSTEAGTELGYDAGERAATR